MGLHNFPIKIEKEKRNLGGCLFFRKNILTNIDFSFLYIFLNKLDQFFNLIDILRKLYQFCIHVY